MLVMIFYHKNLRINVRPCMLAYFPFNIVWNWLHFLPLLIDSVWWQGIVPVSSTHWRQCIDPTIMVKREEWGRLVTTLQTKKCLQSTFFLFSNLFLSILMGHNHTNSLLLAWKSLRELVEYQSMYKRCFNECIFSIWTFAFL